jgi:hypothetical protein
VTVSDGAGGVVTVTVPVTVTGGETSWIAPDTTKDPVGQSPTSPAVGDKLQAHGIVIEAVAGSGGTSSRIAAIDASGFVVRAVGEIGDLGSTTGLEAASDAVLLSVDRPSIPSIDGHSSVLTGFANVETRLFSGYSAVIADHDTFGIHGRISVESVKFRGQLILSFVEKNGLASEAIKSVNVTSVDGASAPRWLERGSINTYFASPPSDVERFALRLIIELEDGQSVARVIVIDAISGKITLAAESASYPKQGRMFSDQFAPLASPSKSDWSRLEAALGL